MNESKLRVALISAGMIANMAHIPAYKSLGGRVDIVGVCDINPVSAEATAKRHGIPEWFTDAEEMLRSLRPDLVSICTPNASHKKLTMLALDYGAHVACEKPIALTYRDAKEMFDFAKAKNRTLFACQVLRYQDEFRFAREMAGDGTLGRVYYAEFSCIRRRGIPKWGTFHRMDANGGGCFCDIGVHMVDAALWIMGNPVLETVSGMSASNLGRSEAGVVTSLAESGAPAGVHNARPFSPEEFEVEEFAAGTIRLAGGVILNFKTSWAVNLPNEYKMLFAGEKAGITLPKCDLHTVMGRYQADVAPRLFHEGPYAGKDFAGHYYLMENAADHLQYGTELLVKPEETLNVAAVIDAFYLSAKKGREVRASEVTGI